MKARMPKVRLNTQEIGLETALACSDAAGIYCWDIQTDRLFGDSHLAYLFDLDAEQVQQGLPFEAFITRIHPGDVTRLAASIEKAVFTGGPFQEEYRILTCDRSHRWVLAVGHCFRSKDGLPLEYAGMVFDITQQKMSPFLALTHQCNIALEMATLVGNESVVQKLKTVIDELNFPHPLAQDCF